MALDDVGGAGSPPPMRGKDKKSPQWYTIPGITPAYAGKRPTPPTQKDFTRDHPRLCGEKVHAFSFSSDFLGSPPPMRGKATKT